MPATDEKGGALATAAVAAAAGVAAYGLRKALNSEGGMTSLMSRNDNDDDDDDDDGYVDDDEDDDGEERNGGSKGRGGSLLASVWDSASGTLMPLAEEAADAAGKWTAENAPDVVRDHLVPRFIESFNDAA